MTESKDKGWIKVDRSLDEEWIWGDVQRYDNLRAWLDILLNVNYKSKTVTLNDECIEIEAGCILTSMLKLSKRWSWSRATVSKFLKLLKKSEKIDYKRIGNGILIRVLSKNEENRDTPKIALQSGDEAFFCTSDEQPPIQPSLQPSLQPVKQPADTTKESNKDNKVLERDKGRKEEEYPADQPKIKYSENIFSAKGEYDEFERLMWEKMERGKG